MKPFCFIVYRCIFSVRFHYVLRVAGYFHIHCIHTRSRQCRAAITHATKGMCTTLLEITVDTKRDYF